MNTFFDARGLTIAPSQALPALGGLYLDVVRDLTCVQHVWLGLQQEGVTTLYQTYQWSAAWQDTINLAQKSEAVVVVARDAAGAVQFLLPFQLTRRLGLTLLEWFGCADLNYGYGLYAQGFHARAADWFSRHLPAVLALLPAHDAIYLIDMPERLFDRAHPLHSFFNVRCANRFYVADLTPDFDTLYASKRSPDTRKNKQRSDAKLMALPGFYVGPPRSGAERRDAVGQMLACKRLQLAKVGVHHVFTEAQHAFIHQLAASRSSVAPLIDIMLVAHGDDILAVSLSATVSQAHWFFMTAMLPGPLQKYSAGDLALRRLIEKCCGEHIARFDFGVGDADYKAQWADHVIDLCAIIRCNTLRSLPWALGMLVQIGLKRYIKRTPWLRALAYRLRKTLLGRKD